MVRPLLFALLCLAGPLLAADPLPLPEGVQLLRGDFVPGRQPDGNSVLIAAPAGWIVVDSGRHAAHTARIVEAPRADGRPLLALVNTHWHLDHVSGNPALRAEWPALQVHASDAIDAALTGFLARYRAQLQVLLAQATDDEQRAQLGDEIARIDAGAALRPDQVVSATGERVLAGRSLLLGLSRHAATAGDVWLFDRERRLLVAGDLVTLPVPFLDTACPPRWQAELATLAALEFDTVIPGHGPALDRAGFERYRAAVDGLLACAASAATPGDCAGRWLDDAGPLLDGSDAAFTRRLVEYYVNARLRGAAAGGDCPG